MTTRIDSQKILYPVGGNDECLTPDYAVTPLLKHLIPNSTIWCPFDEADSAFVRVLSAAGHDVEYSHIKYGQNFFDYEYEDVKHFDYILSNPPYTGKADIFRHALSLNVAFAFLMSMAWMNDSAPAKLWLEAKRQAQLLKFDNRIKYGKRVKGSRKIDWSSDKITFSSGYYATEVFFGASYIVEHLEIPKGFHKVVKDEFHS